MVLRNSLPSLATLLVVVLSCTGATWITSPGKGSHAPVGGVAISRVQFTQNGSSASVASVATPNFGASCTSGNLIVIIARADGLTPPTSVADTLGTTYTNRISQSASGTSDPTIHVYSGVLGSSGTNAITITWPAPAQYKWVIAIEYNAGSGTWVAPFDAAVGSTTTGVTDIAGSAITTSQASTVVIMAASQGAFTTYTAGTDFTLISGTLGGGGNNFGGAQERITSGVLTSYVSHITSGSTTLNSAVVVAFKN